MKGLDVRNGIYRSPPRRRGVLAQIAPTLAFYACFAAIVTRSANQAKRGIYDDARWEQSSHDTRRCLEKSGLRFTAEGLEHLEGLEGPCVFVANHMSMLETVVLPGLIRPYVPLTFVVKESLVRYPLFGHVMTARDPIVVTRTDPRADFQAVMEGGRTRLANGTSIVVFPQTTRTVDFDRREFNTIGAKLARRAGVPLVPIAMRTDAWGLSKRLMKDLGRLDTSKHVNFAFGAPMPVTGRGKEAHEYALAFIEEHLVRWGLPPVDPAAGA